jgi:hypothetical protein
VFFEVNEISTQSIFASFSNREAIQQLSFSCSKAPLSFLHFHIKSPKDLKADPQTGSPLPQICKTTVNDNTVGTASKAVFVTINLRRLPLFDFNPYCHHHSLT